MNLSFKLLLYEQVYYNILMHFYHLGRGINISNLVNPIFVSHFQYFNLYRYVIIHFNVENACLN